MHSPLRRTKCWQADSWKGFCLWYASRAESFACVISVYLQKSSMNDYYPFTDRNGAMENLKNGFCSKMRCQSQGPAPKALSLSTPRTASLPGLTVILCKLYQRREDSEARSQKLQPESYEPGRPAVEGGKCGCLLRGCEPKHWFTAKIILTPACERIVQAYDSLATLLVVWRVKKADKQNKLIC